MSDFVPDSAASAPFAIAVAVGPGQREIDRLRDLADAIGTYERGPAWLVLIDDDVAPRNLDQLVSLPPAYVTVSLPSPRRQVQQTYRIGKGICSAVLLALGWIQANTTAQFVLKLDTDSLVINPFAERLAALFRRSPSLGMVGAHTLTPNGTARDWSHQRQWIQALLRPPSIWRDPRRAIRRQPEEWVLPIDRLLKKANANGYDLGEHCLGGGYAVSRALMDRMAAEGYLANPVYWARVDLPEDVVVGLHVRATGLTLENHVAPGDVFGVRYEGLSDVPEVLVEKQYAVVHAVKNDKRLDEASVRSFFKLRREQSLR